MNGKLQASQDKFISYISRACDDFGLNSFVAQLYAVLYLNDGSMSLDSLSERLKASKGNVSLNIRELEKWGAVHKVWVRGSRKDYYEADLDVKKVLFSKIKSSLRKRLNDASSMINDMRGYLEEGEKQFTENDRKTAQVYKERIKKVEKLKDLGIKVLNLVDKVI